MTIKPTLQRFSAAANDRPPRHLGTRYDRQGRFLPEPGNTVVCHLVEGSATAAALAGVRTRLMAMPDAASLAFTPLPSLHMTLFQGIIEYRRAQPYWPPDVPADTAIDTMTALYRRRLDGFRGCGPFRVKAIDVVPTGVTVAGATPDDERSLAAWRDALSEPFGYRHPDHDRYVFHITLAYMIDWLPEDRLPAWQAVLDESLAVLRRTTPVLELRPPAFCRFADMCWFEALLPLG